MTTRASRRSSNHRAASASSRSIIAFIAFNRSGRLSVSRPSGPLISTLIVENSISVTHSDTNLQPISFKLPTPCASRIERSPQRLSENRLLGVGEFFVAAVVAASVDQLFGGSQICFRRLPRILHPSALIPHPFFHPSALIPHP